MKTVEERVHDLICDYITKRIRSNLRVTTEMETVNDIQMEKDLKAVLNKAFKLIPDNLTVIERGK